MTGEMETYRAGVLQPIRRSDLILVGLQVGL